MEELLLKLIEEVRKTYKDKKAADLVFKRLFAATKGSSDYTEAFELAKRAGHDLEDAIIENWATLMQDSEVFASTAKQLLKGVVPDMNEDILKACEQIQDNKNAAAGMRIKPQTAVADPYDLNRIAEGLDGKKMSALDGELATYACKTVDSTERANMDFAMSSGYEIKVKRTYDGVGLRRKTKYAERCSYCLERAGSRTFKNSQAVNSSGIFARHEGCGCTIDYENQRTGTKSNDVQNFYTGKKKKTTKLRGNAESVESNLEKARKNDIIKNKENPLDIEYTGQEYQNIVINNFLTDPKRLGNSTPEEKYFAFIEHGAEVKGLGRSNSVNKIDFLDGGGFRILGDHGELLMYHPTRGSHHGGEYYKLSDGKTSTLRYDMGGNFIKDEKNGKNN